MKKKIISWLAHEDRLLKYPLFRRFFWKRGVVYRRMEELASNMRKKEIITVAFMVQDLSCWKCDSVFRLMLRHPRFRPIIWLVPELQVKDVDENQRKVTEIRKYFAERGDTVADLYSLEQIRTEYGPDIVFLSKPYLGGLPWGAWSMDRELVCYVPYCYQNTQRDDFLYGQENHVWRNFYATEGVKKIASSLMLNGGCNVLTTGAPFADNFLFPEQSGECTAWKQGMPSMKKVIWAPHWTVLGDSFFSVSTFLKVADGILELAEKYANSIQWTFKPHPLLRDSLYRHPEWGKARTDAYYERWATMPNTQLKTGDYVDLFKQSDAMIHDSGSFIMEYLLVNKPCMYLQEGAGYTGFNEDTLQALKCYQKGSSLKEIEQFLLNLLRNAPDTKASARARYIKEYLLPPGGRSAAQNIINSILSGR